jgi:hypothetical protein
MKKMLLVCVLVLLAVSAFGEWDYFAFVYDNVAIGSIHEIEGTVAHVKPFGGYWLTIIYTCAESNGYYQTGEVGYLTKKRTINWNPGTRVVFAAVFNETWERDGTFLPTFREIEK